MAARQSTTKPITYLAMGLVLLVLGAVQTYYALTQFGDVARINWIAAGACIVIAPLLIWRYFVLRRKDQNAR